MLAARRARWLVVFGSTIALTVSNGPIILFTFGVFLKPISEQFGWSRSTMSLGVTVALTLAGLATPIVGRMIDRWGVQRVTLVIISLFAASFSAISLTPNNVVVFVLAYSLSGLLASGQAPLPYAKAISGWFESQRGLALGVAMAGIGVGIAIVPQVANALLQRFDWRAAYLVTGLIVWLVAFPTVFFFVKDPPPTEKSSPVEVGDTTSDALRSRSFWLMLAASFFVVTALNGVIAHLVPLLTDAGVPQQTALTTLVAVGLSSIIGRLVSGFLLDRIFAPYLAAAVFLVPVVATSIILTGTTTPALVLSVAACLGFCLGAEVDVIGFVVGRYFGLRHYGEIYGYIFAAFTVGSGVGPYLLSLSFDFAGGYRTGLLVASGLLVLSSCLIACLGPYRYPAPDSPAQKGS